jgi:hypothetical protein
MAATNKRYSSPRVAVIRTDVHPAGENSINTHTLFTLNSHMVPDHTSPVVRIDNLLLVPTRMKQAPTLGRSLGDRRQTGPVIVAQTASSATLTAKIRLIAQHERHRKVSHLSNSYSHSLIRQTV